MQQCEDFQDVPTDDGTVEQPDDGLSFEPESSSTDGLEVVDGRRAPRPTARDKKKEELRELDKRVKG